MSVTDSPAVAAPTRRERQRQATFDEIVERRAGAAARARRHRAARGRPGDGHDRPGALPLRRQPRRAARARRPRDLRRHRHRALREPRPITRTTIPAPSSSPRPSPSASWALAHPQEFGLDLRQPRDGAPEEARQRRRRLRHLLRRPLRAGLEALRVRGPGRRRPAPTTSSHLLEAAQEVDALPCDFPGSPIGLNWIFMRAWSRLYGIVTLEVFGHLDDGLIASGCAVSGDDGRQRTRPRPRRRHGPADGDRRHQTRGGSAPAGPRLKDPDRHPATIASLPPAPLPPVFPKKGTI